MRPANDDMVRGFMDGYDKNSPDPGPNTSMCYRHGFECGRDDLLCRVRFSAAELRQMADEAMEYDEDPLRSLG